MLDMHSTSLGQLGQGIVPSPAHLLDGVARALVHG
jgi:hypothetical protein